MEVRCHVAKTHHTRFRMDPSSDLAHTPAVFGLFILPIMLVESKHRASCLLPRLARSYENQNSLAELQPKRVARCFKDLRESPVDFDVSGKIPWRFG